MEGMGKLGTVSVMYVIQTIINVIIPSGSAKAALTMPVMAPFSDLVNLSRQATVVAFQFGDGFTNMITPTSGVLNWGIGSGENSIRQMGEMDSSLYVDTDYFRLVAVNSDRNYAIGRVLRSFNSHADIQTKRSLD